VGSVVEQVETLVRELGARLDSLTAVLVGDGPDGGALDEIADELLTLRDELGDAVMPVEARVVDLAEEVADSLGPLEQRVVDLAAAVERLDRRTAELADVVARPVGALPVPAPDPPAALMVAATVAAMARLEVRFSQEFDALNQRLDQLIRVREIEPRQLGTAVAVVDSEGARETSDDAQVSPTNGVVRQWRARASRWLGPASA
jgi:hypothetical protein